MSTPNPPSPTPGKRPHDAAAGAAGAPPSRWPQKRWPWIVGGVALALLLFLAVFDWNLLRGPTERFATRSLGRSVTIGHLDVGLRGLAPRVVLTDVAIGNPDWVDAETMGRAKQLAFTVRPHTLLTREIVIPHLQLTSAEAGLVRDAQGRANWRFREKDDTGRREVRVLTLTVDDARIGYRDALVDVAADVHGFTRRDGPYETRIDFAGKWRGAPFQGTADTGSVLSLRGSSEPFPMRISGRAGATRLRAEGTVADITRFRHIDADVAISGPSLATLYATLKVALPETPPYSTEGRLKRDGDVYTYENFKGRIGRSDVAGNARYTLREPRPVLNADLRSDNLDVADLGPLVGVKSGGASPAAARAEREGNGRVIPATDFRLEKLNAMDADVRVAAARLQLPGKIQLLEDFAGRVQLNAGVLRLDPLNFDFAGGKVEGRIAVDASRQPMAGDIEADFSRVRLARLLPDVKQARESSGTLGAQLRLKGQGNSPAELLASADGSVTAAMAGGRVSEIAVWLVNLHGGELIPLLFGGDKPTPIRCGAAALDVNDGIGKIGLFVFDTEESRIGADGAIDFGKERVDVTLYPRPKKPGLLSIRGPVHITGSFGDLDFQPSAQSLARGLGALALGFVNPLLSLIPLIETGPGEDAPCRALLSEVKGAVRESGKSVQAAPPDGGRAPVVDVRPGKAASSDKRREGTVGLEQKGEERAPIVEVDPRKADGDGKRQRPAPVIEVPAKK